MPTPAIFWKFNDRLGAEMGIEFSSFVPGLYLPALLQKIGYRTNAMVSLPVLNPATILNTGFDSYKLMDRHNDMRAMVPRKMSFSEEQPSFHFFLKRRRNALSLRASGRA